jgi:UDP-N-acetylglucosamine 2-epimerase (hydrolysing)
MTSPRRKIVFLTGTRADFGKLKPLILPVASDPLFEYEIFATGMHMLARYGKTIQEIQKSGLHQVYPFINQDGSINSQMDLVLGTTVQGLGHYVRESRPDLLVVHGDRIEALAGAIVGALNNIHVAHVEGGERSGTVDELLRHAVSKLAHLHLVANEEAMRRLLQLGEDPEAVFVVGSPEIDVMLSDTLPALHEVRERYEIPFDPYGVMIYHPVTTELATQGRRTEEVIQGVLRSERNFVVIYPNNDAGSDVIRRRLEELQGHPRIRLLPSMRFEHFLSLLRGADLILGNSSAGIREAPVYGTPTVNVGTRQQDRNADNGSIRNVPEEADAIVACLAGLRGRVPPSQHFGDGRSADRFHELLRSGVFWSIPTQKRFVDLG